jgi:hypothetical protein
MLTTVKFKGTRTENNFMALLTAAVAAAETAIKKIVVVSVMYT